MENKSRYAIQVIGYGARTRFVIRKCRWNGSDPIPGLTVAFRSEEAARKAAEAAGIKIDAVGDCYEITAGLM